MPYLHHHGCKIHYSVTGNGPNVVLLHGLGSGSRDWEPQITALAPRYRVLAIDLPGHGHSQRWPDERPYSIARFADDLKSVMEHVGMLTAHIVGFSMGGAVAFQLATTHAGCVHSLTIVNSAPSFIFKGIARATLWQRIGLIHLLGMSALGKVLATRLFPENPELQREFTRSFRGNDKKSYLATMRALDGWDVRQSLPDITCPTLIVASNRDYTPVKHKRAYALAIPNATLEIIEGAHHAVPLEKADVFNATLFGFLDSIEALPEAV